MSYTNNPQISAVRVRQLRVGAFALGAMLALVLCLGVAPAARANLPQFQNGDGITVLSQSQTGREIDLTVETTAVAGTHKIIVLLPNGYTSSVHYPTLYLLNGALAEPTQWVSEGGEANQITAPYPVIVVALDGGVKGWYLNWQSCATICPQNWETFHLEQAVPWIDSNLSTIANRSGRAIAGLSMGGWGAIHYAEARPDLFSYVGSYSGAVDTGNETTDLAILAEELGLISDSGTPVPAGSILGPEDGGLNPYAVSISGVNPTNVAKLQNTTVGLYVGTGDILESPGDGIIETAVYPQNELMAYNLAQAGVNYWYSQDLVNSESLGFGCDNNHDIMCWNAYLNNDMPRIMDALTPPEGYTPPPPPSGNVVADPGFESSGLGPWACVNQCGVDNGLGNAYAGEGNGWVRNTTGWNDIHQIVSVVPNTNYTLTGWLRTSSDNSAGYFGVRSMGGTVIGQTEYNSLPGYTKLTVHLNSGNNSEVQVFGGLWALNQDTWAQIDEVSLAAG